jgi:signal transduction histidine kinase
MNAILGFSELLANEDYTDEHKAHATIIRESAKNLLNLINDILDFSKIEAGQLDIETINCSLGEVLKFLESMMKPQAEGKSLDFQFMVEDDVPAQIHSDPNRLQQCLTNLVYNAIKFTDQGHVHVKVSLCEGNRQDSGTASCKSSIRFDVEDTGIGIPEDRQQVIFEPFQQADGSTTRKYGGTGIGLSVAKNLATLLGGELSLTGEPGNGSVFSLVIPSGMDIVRPATRSHRACQRRPQRARGQRS